MSIQCDIKSMTDQFNRLEGQISGIGRMIEAKRDCEDIIQQIIAARSSLERLGKLLLEAEANGCFSGGTTSEEKVKKLEHTVSQLFKITS